MENEPDKALVRGGADPGRLGDLTCWTLESLSIVLSAVRAGGYHRANQPGPPSSARQSIFGPGAERASRQAAPGIVDARKPPRFACLWRTVWHTSSGRYPVNLSPNPNSPAVPPVCQKSTVSSWRKRPCPIRSINPAAALPV